MALAAIKKKLSLTFLVKFRAFEKQFLRNHTVYQAQISEITEITMFNVQSFHLISFIK